MTIYLDASALVKLVVAEPETEALRAFLGSLPDERRVTSALSRTEVIRAMLPDRPDLVPKAREVLAAVDQIAVGQGILDDAVTLAPTAAVRSLDAIHLASARLFGAGLRSLVTYDARMAAAAEQLLIPVDAPA